MDNIDQNTVSSFGNEWYDFDQSKMSYMEIKKIFDEYFSIFPFYLLTDKSEGFDMGCGSGRWARLMAPKVKKLHCIDPSSAIEVARRNLSDCNNIIFHKSSVDKVLLSKSSQDFGYSLGVLHHVPDTEKAIKSCVFLLKTGAPLLLYLYYNFDNRPFFYRTIWKFSDMLRYLIYHLPYKIRRIMTDIIAIAIYYPLARLSYILSLLDVNTSNIPLSYYKDHTFYTMRTDSRDRFGTPLEKRFTKAQIEIMMKNSGLGNIHFSDSAPYWCVVGIKK
ncbi:class I SAM-dependent methyltransferase [bacterium]|jgi:ubiquinone/menaquinone biosynthesis C-methylase UbiE|nr:class I SAM-dependent methyltransferase [bacterium]